MDPIREYVRLLIEFDEGGDFWGGEGGGGYFDPGSKMLAQAFGLTGMKDIAKTALYGLEKLSGKAQHLIGVTASGLAGALVPFVEGKYEELDEAERRRTEQLKVKYRDVFERTDKAFYNEDFRVASFLFNPVKYLTAMAGFRAPSAALDALDAVTARNSYVSAFTDEIRRRFSISSPYKKEKGGESEDLASKFAAMFGEAVEQERLLEAKLTPKNLMKRVMTQDKVRRVLAQSKYIKSMQEDAQKMIKAHVTDVVSFAKKAGQINSVDDLKKLQKIDLSALDKLEDNERKAAEQALVKHAQGLVKKFAQEQLEKKGKQLPIKLKALVDRGIQAIEAL